MRSTVLAITLLLMATPSAHASLKHSRLQCSIHPRKGTPEANLPSLARVSESEARETALKAIKSAAPVQGSEGELEVERGCLIYSFDIRVPGKRGIEEVIVDAGSGKVLEHAHETPAQESAERAGEKPTGPSH